jgi:hypothetical protein
MKAIMGFFILGNREHILGGFIVQW